MRKRWSSFSPLETKKTTFVAKTVTGKCQTSKSRRAKPPCPPSDAHGSWRLVVCCACGTSSIQNQLVTTGLWQNFEACFRNFCFHEFCNACYMYRYFHGLGDSSKKLTWCKKLPLSTPYAQGKGYFRGESCWNPVISKENDSAGAQFCKKFEPRLIEQDDVIISKYFLPRALMRLDPTLVIQCASLERSPK